jgi:hypothetical protein
MPMAGALSNIIVQQTRQTTRKIARRARTLWPAHNFDCLILDSKYAQKPLATHVFDFAV